MVSKQDVIVNLSRLLRNDPHALGEVEASGHYLPEVVQLADDLEVQKPLDYRLVIRSVGDDEFLLTGTITGKALMPCRRCLKPLEVGWKSDLMYSMEFVPSVAELNIRLDENDDEVLEFGRPEVDFAVLLTDVFTVDRPITVAHPDGDPDCEDLAGKYGTDQETAAEDGASPFASLKDFDIESTEE